MSGADEPHADAPASYAVPLDALVRSARVPVDEQVAEQPSLADQGSDWAWDEDRRQLQLGGGA